MAAQTLKFTVRQGDYIEQALCSVYPPDVAAERRETQRRFVLDKADAGHIIDALQDNARHWVSENVTAYSDAQWEAQSDRVGGVMQAVVDRLAWAFDLRAVTLRW